MTDILEFVHHSGLLFFNLWVPTQNTQDLYTGIHSSQ